MFSPKTEKITKLAGLYPQTVAELENILQNSTAIYLDFANMIHWSEKLKWHIDLKRLKQLFDSFDTVKYVRFYNGTLTGDKDSEDLIALASSLGYNVTTKPVKRMKLSIDVSSIDKSSPFVLQKFIKKPLLNKLTVEALEYLNSKLRELNIQGIYYLEQWKCNFDVEIGRDMSLDWQTNNIENFVLWSGDSDFADPIQELLADKKQVTVVSTARRIAPELSNLGIFIFEIWKAKDFICWNREISSKGRNVL